MDDARRLLIERECERLVTAYCHEIDHGHAARVANLFTSDGVWIGFDVTLRGTDELRAGFAHRQATTISTAVSATNSFAIDVSTLHGRPAFASRVAW